ncbi:hypothetical protein ALC57_14224 [Trachymyrmex cornetzi]|uniref:Uncharacterized protein n=1 Tax=Trachymyrmex cornetzi TaxID=471704 RepID=A0A195DKV7_9HYME|nr:hypothetical protein ALC57_14224 [Trachymyrmex cornetzi]
MGNSLPMTLTHLMEVITLNNLRKVVAVTHHTLQKPNNIFQTTSWWKRLTWYAQFGQAPFASRPRPANCEEINDVSFSFFVSKRGATSTVKQVCPEDFVELYVGISLKFTVPSALALRTVSDRWLKSLDIVEDHVSDPRLFFSLIPLCFSLDIDSLRWIRTISRFAQIVEQDPVTRSFFSSPFHSAFSASPVRLYFRPLRNVNPENCVSSCDCYDDDSCGADGGGDVPDAASERPSPAGFDGLLGGPRCP